MSGPAPFPSDLLDLDLMLEQIGGAGWDGLERQFRPAAVPDRFEPADQLKIRIATLYDHSDEVRQILEWVFDLTFRAPYPHVGESFQAAALAAKAHEARAAVGRVIVQAIVDGRKLKEKRSQTNANTA